MEMQDAMAFLSALQILHQSVPSHLGSRAPLPLALPPATMNQQQLQAVADVNELMLLSAAQYPGALHLGVPFPPFGLPPRASPMPPAFAPPTTTQTAAPTSASSAPSPTVVAAAAPGPKHQSQATAKRSRRVSMTTSSASRMSSPKTTSHSKMDINFLTTPSPCPDHSFDFGAVVEWSSPLSSPRSPRLDRSCGEESPLPPSPPAATEAGRVDHHQAGDRVVQLAAEEAKERWREREESMVSLKHTHKAIAANRMAQHNQNQKRRRTDQPSSSSSSGSSGSSGSSQEDEDEESDGGHDAAGGGREPRVMSGRTCMHCGITSTPEWRTGPDGKGTLCNACGLRYRKFVRAEEKRGVVIAFPAMPALAKPRKRRRPAGEQQQSGEADGGTESVLMDTTRTTKQDNRDHAHKKQKKKRKATAS